MGKQVIFLLSLGLVVTLGSISHGQAPRPTRIKEGRYPRLSVSYALSTDSWQIPT
jgi:hypothetical protein